MTFPRLIDEFSQLARKTRLSSFLNTRDVVLQAGSKRCLLYNEELNFTGGQREVRELQWRLIKSCRERGNSSIKTGLMAGVIKRMLKLTKKKKCSGNSLVLPRFAKLHNYLLWIRWEVSTQEIGRGTRAGLRSLQTFANFASFLAFGLSEINRKANSREKCFSLFFLPEPIYCRLGKCDSDRG